MSFAHTLHFYTSWPNRNLSNQHRHHPENHLISRTLLIKESEFGDVIVLNANKKNLYAVMTRATKSLTVLSNDPIIRK